MINWYVSDRVIMYCSWYWNHCFRCNSLCTCGISRRYHFISSVFTQLSFGRLRFWDIFLKFGNFGSLTFVIHQLIGFKVYFCSWPWVSLTLSSWPWVSLSFVKVLLLGTEYVVFMVVHTQALGIMIFLLSSEVTLLRIMQLQHILKCFKIQLAGTVCWFIDWI